MTNLTLLEAMQRIHDSTTANEGPDAKCVFHPRDPDSRTLRYKRGHEHVSAPMPVREILESLRDRVKPELRDSPAMVVRTVRNWAIADKNGEIIYSSHPWDDTPNVAKLGTRPDPAHIESLVQFSSRVQELANEAERLRQFVIAQSLWQMVSVINDYTGHPVENAIREARRLTEVVAALVPTPKPRA